MTDFNILFTAAGRRVSLLRHFRKTLDDLGVKGKIIAADAGLSAPASVIADEQLLTPKVSHSGYIDFLLRYCQENSVHLLISLIDSDLVLLSQHKDAFRKVNTTLLVCDEETNNICFNKHNTYQFFSANNIATPQVFTERDIAALKKCDYPVLIKPWDGSCSVGVTVIHNRSELEFFRHYVRHAMVQEFVQGDEYTCDVFVDLSGTVRCVVPRKRLETRAGEVSKGVTVRDPGIIQAVKNVVEKLPHAIGCITVQCFRQMDGSIMFIEINPRFGGGVPLSISAGADFPKWIIQEIMGLICEAGSSEWKDNLAMLRYDDEIIVPGNQIV